MDVNDLRAAVTLLTFLVFIGIVWWAFSTKRKQSFDEVALLPFTDDEPVDSAYQGASHGNTERKAS